MEADGRPRNKPTSPWVYVGCGCGLAVLLALAGLTGLTWWGVQKGKEFERNFKDPQARAAKTREVLPYRELPAGYHPAGSFSIPFLMDVAILSDEEPTADKAPKAGEQAEFRERGFVYMNMRRLRDNREKMERFLRGEAPPPDESPWQQSNVNFDPKQVIGRGAVETGGQQVLYAASRGEISRKDHRHEEGIVTMVMPRCPDDRLRFGLWFGPDPSPDKPIHEADYAGTNADPAAIQEFLSHFQLCGK
ncbi:MAG TPA: hypothetical protein VGG03_18575 [Thermoanaerobaculia bacterium]|jgi:hypothetical protein